MAGKLTLKGELEEELMEAVSLYSNFAENDLEDVLQLIEANEIEDHLNDRIRNETMSFLLQGLEAYNAKDYEGMQKYLHAALQKLHSQELSDLKDDRPRTDAKVKLAVLRQKAINNTEMLKEILARLNIRIPEGKCKP